MANPAASSQKGSPIPPDNLQRKLSVANSESAKMRHLSVGGGTYTILLTGKETAGRNCLIDMHVPPGAGPPPHRHDFEEMFTVLDGEIELTFRGKRSTASAGDTINIPANAPHWFKNISETPARLLCMCTPPGQEEFFLAIADPVDSRTAPSPPLTKEEQGERMKKAKALAPKYRTELLNP